MRARFYYVYILRSLSEQARFYSGFTTHPDDRLAHHNAGAVPATKPYRPWAFKTVIAFTEEHQALAFERYLKTHAGRAFARKRL